MVKFISNLFLPLLVLGILLYAVRKKVAVYDTFLEGAKESFDMILGMFPCLLAMILAVNLFMNSNFLGKFFEWIAPVLNFMKVPEEIIPMALMRPISGTSSLAILNNLFAQFGPDGTIGHLASVIQGSTDTTFYVITLYFGSIGIKKIRYALWGGLFADFVSIIASLVIVGLFFG